MKILVLGGTKFLGRHLVESAISRGHSVTIFNRGLENPELFDNVEKLIGDRDGKLEALKNRKWDAVIDTSAYIPRIVRETLKVLADNINHYTFISTISVYKDFLKEDIDETYPTGIIEDESVEEVNGETYGPLKAMCEREAINHLPEKSLIVRPGLIVGPYDPTDRFSYWPYRISNGGRILAPDHPKRQVQFIDVRDLSDWIIHMLEEDVHGTYNATGPKDKLTIGELLNQCSDYATKEVDLEWVSEEFILKNNLSPYTDIPLWVPNDSEYKGFSKVDISKAISKGLRFRRLDETIKDTLDWLSKTNRNNLKAGITREKETELLELWDNEEK